MAHFWLGTFELERPAGAIESPAAPLLATRARTLAIEVLCDDKEFAVLFSTVDDLQQPASLKCCVGFANAAEACSIWRDRGFPLVDATIRYTGNTLEVISPYFAEPSQRDFTAMQYEVPLLTITGVEFSAKPDSAWKLTTSYEQFQEAPDGAGPATSIVRKSVTWIPERSSVHQMSPGGVDLDLAPSRCPSLAPFAKGSLKPAGVWSGVANFPQAGLHRNAQLTRVSRTDTFGMPAFRFDDVEVLGFRIDLGTLGRDFEKELAELIEPLNFHLDRSSGGTWASGRNAISDFRYRPASRTLLIELLRYGSMKLKSPSLPLGVDDYQTQHELLVRVLVGRVDDDTAQAHAPAVYVPAIFVDNPWSKVLGRDVQGFDKRMAHFCIAQGNGIARLCPDGRIVDPRRGTLSEKPVPLAQISTINLVDKAGSSEGPTILELDCSPDMYENWNAFEKVDLQLAVGSSSLASTRWRQSDFDQAEFRRSFARSAIAESLKGFRSIQVSPVADRGLEKTWITGTFTVDDDIQIVRPAGVASLTFHSQQSAPRGWRLLCKILGGGGESESFTTGNWYRLKCAMDLTVDNGLDWDTQGS